MAARVKLQSGADRKTCLLLGCGYTARAMIPGLQQAGFEIYGTTRSDQKAQELRSLGVEPVLYAGAVTTQMRQVLTRSTHLISSIAPNPKGDPFIQSLMAHFGKNWAKVMPSIEWAGYLSATSVYGDRQGQWVFEEELLYPSTRRGKSRVLAELDWMESGLPVHIFRIAGIYGPGRNVLNRIRNGGIKAVIKKDHVSNRIHVDDIASAVTASMSLPHPLAIYNLADDTPAPPQDILRYGAELIGAKKVQEVPIEKAQMSEMAKSFYREARRTSNTRAKQELGWQPRYPSYKEGLAAILKAEANA